jgi:hypothetical protein
VTKTKVRKVMHKLGGPPWTDSDLTACGRPVVRGRPTPPGGNEWTISTDPNWPAKCNMTACPECYR